MSEVGIVAIAFNSNGERYDSYHTPPEVRDFIESVSPADTPWSVQDGGRFVVVDTTKADCTVTAAPAVTVSAASGGTEDSAFSFWFLPPMNPKEWRTRDLAFHKGESGLVALYYGRGGRPHMEGPRLDKRTMQDWYIYLMTRMVPGWQPPDPEGGMRIPTTA
jgi:hypothetical protein